MDMWKKIFMKRIFHPFLLLILAAAPVFSQDTEGIDVHIRFFDKKLYYIDSPVMLKIEITNNTPNTFRFELADNRIFNIDFEVRTLSNRPLPRSEKLNTERTSNQQVFFRDVTLGPMEQFSFYEDLSNYIQIDEPGAYIVQAIFYPDLITPGVRTDTYRSNRLNLSIRPGERDMTLPVYEDTTEMARLKKKSLPPDEVVEHTIHARQQSNWEQFFLYLDIENLLKNDPARRRSYLRLNEEGMRRMEQEYMEALKNEQVDGDIVVIPEEFEIIKTEYTPEEAEVIVIEKFQYPGYKEVKEYTYFLKKRDNVWFIYDYDVRNLGTE
jgi:hypothetical protein